MSFHLVPHLPRLIGWERRTAVADANVYIDVVEFMASVTAMSLKTVLRCKQGHATTKKNTYGRSSHMAVKFYGIDGASTQLK